MFLLRNKKNKLSLNYSQYPLLSGVLYLYLQNQRHRKSCRHHKYFQTGLLPFSSDLDSLVNRIEWQLWGQFHKTIYDVFSSQKYRTMFLNQNLRFIKKKKFTKFSLSGVNLRS